ncbi:unnamed protein product [Vitrella brassicaformis CCMP3155]|uniref:GAIN-B domain-containing protein n=2 Tax=Vitrella brassicaformis TaxID=1169539 RepID=A0A0G4EFL7_VITBC|nr:unnamed protein product [Vitrella brassicaformis CCMP3155]|eukprot:CEL94532.1 unnamed protein product [Vitrella brassicaformis CCMP3155]
MVRQGARAVLLVGCVALLLSCAGTKRPAKLRHNSGRGAVSSTHGRSLQEEQAHDAPDPVSPSLSSLSLPPSPANTSTLAFLLNFTQPVAITADAIMLDGSICRPDAVCSVDSVRPTEGSDVGDFATVWEVEVSVGDGEGVLEVDLGADMVLGEGGNALNKTASEQTLPVEIEIDTVAPSLVSMSSPPGPIPSATFPITLHFSEPVALNASAFITLTGPLCDTRCSVLGSSGLPAADEDDPEFEGFAREWEVTIEADEGDGNLTVAVAAGDAAVVDRAGNAIRDGRIDNGTLTVAIDTVVPTLVSADAPQGPLSTPSFTVNLTFSEPVANIQPELTGDLCNATAGLMCNITSIDAFSPDGEGYASRWSFVVSTAGGEGRVVVSLVSDASTDRAGLAPADDEDPTVVTRIIDTVAPSLLNMSTSSPLVASTSFDVSLTFSEPVAVDIDRVVTLRGPLCEETECRIAEVEPAGDADDDDLSDQWVVTVEAGDEDGRMEGSVVIDVNENALRDRAGNALNATASPVNTTGFEQSIDSVPPRLMALRGQRANATSQTIAVNATFSEPVSFDSTRIELSGSACDPTNCTIGAVRPLEAEGEEAEGDLSSVWQVDIVAGEEEGTVFAQFLPSVSSDAAGNELTTDGEEALLATFSVDGVRPRLSFLSLPFRVLNLTSLTVTAVFSEPVALNASGIQLSGSACAQDNDTCRVGPVRPADDTIQAFASRWAIEVVVGETEGRLRIAVLTSAGADNAGNELEVQTFGGVDGDIAMAISRTIDTRPPRLVSLTAPEGPSLDSATMRIIVTFSEPVSLPLDYSANDTVSAALPPLAVVASGSACGEGGVGCYVSAVDAADEGGERQEWLLNVTAVTEGNVTVRLVPTQIRDRAENGLRVNDTEGGGDDMMVFSRQIDLTGPSITLSSTVPAVTYAPNFTVTAELTEPCDTLTADSLTLRNARLLSFDVDESGVSIEMLVEPIAGGAVRVGFPAGACQDSAGNDNFPSTVVSTTYDDSMPQVEVALAIDTDALPTDASDRPLTRNATLPLSLTFSRPLYATEAPLLNVSNARVVEGFEFEDGSTDVDGVLQADGQGNVSIGVAAGVLQDEYGRPNDGSNTVVLIYDSVRPVPSLSTTSTSPSTTPTPFVVTISLTEPMADLNETDVIITNGTLQSFTPNTERGENVSFSAAVVPNVTDGEWGAVEVRVREGAGNDVAGNPSQASGSLVMQYVPKVRFTTAWLTPTASVRPVTTPNVFHRLAIAARPFSMTVNGTSLTSSVPQLRTTNQHRTYAALFRRSGDISCADGLANASRLLSPPVQCVPSDDIIPSTVTCGPFEMDSAASYELCVCDAVEDSAYRCNGSDWSAFSHGARSLQSGEAGTLSVPRGSVELEVGDSGVPNAKLTITAPASKSPSLLFVGTSVFLTSSPRCDDMGGNGTVARRASALCSRIRRHSDDLLHDVSCSYELDEYPPPGKYTICWGNPHTQHFITLGPIDTFKILPSAASFACRQALQRADVVSVCSARVPSRLLPEPSALVLCYSQCNLPAGSRSQRIGCPLPESTSGARPPLLSDPMACINVEPPRVVGSSLWSDLGGIHIDFDVAVGPLAASAVPTGSQTNGSSPAVDCGALLPPELLSELGSDPRCYWAAGTRLEVALGWNATFGAGGGGERNATILPGRVQRLDAARDVPTVEWVQNDEQRLTARVELPAARPHVWLSAPAVIPACTGVDVFGEASLVGPGRRFARVEWSCHVRTGGSEGDGSYHGTHECPEELKEVFHNASAAQRMILSVPPAMTDPALLRKGFSSTAGDGADGDGVALEVSLVVENFLGWQTNATAVINVSSTDDPVAVVRPMTPQSIVSAAGDKVSFEVAAFAATKGNCSEASTGRCLTDILAARLPVDVEWVFADGSQMGGMTRRPRVSFSPQESVNISARITVRSDPTAVAEVPFTVTINHTQPHLVIEGPARVAVSCPFTLTAVSFPEDRRQSPAYAWSCRYNNTAGESCFADPERNPLGNATAASVAIDAVLLRREGLYVFGVRRGGGEEGEGDGDGGAGGFVEHRVAVVRSRYAMGVARMGDMQRLQMSVQGRINMRAELDVTEQCQLPADVLWSWEVSRLPAPSLTSLPPRRLPHTLVTSFPPSWASTAPAPTMKVYGRLASNTLAAPAWYSYALVVSGADGVALWHHESAPFVVHAAPVHGEVRVHPHQGEELCAAFRMQQGGWGTSAGPLEYSYARRLVVDGEVDVKSEVPLSSWSPEAALVVPLTVPPGMPNATFVIVGRARDRFGGISEAAVLPRVVVTRRVLSQEDVSSALDLASAESTPPSVALGLLISAAGSLQDTEEAEAANKTADAEKEVGPRVPSEADRAVSVKLLSSLGSVVQRQTEGEELTDGSVALQSDAIGNAVVAVDRRGTLDKPNSKNVLNTMDTSLSGAKRVGGMEQRAAGNLVDASVRILQRQAPSRQPVSPSSNSTATKAVEAARRLQQEVEDQRAMAKQLVGAAGNVAELMGKRLKKGNKVVVEKQGLSVAVLADDPSRLLARGGTTLPTRSGKVSLPSLASLDTPAARRAAEEGPNGCRASAKVAAKTVAWPANPFGLGEAAGQWGDTAVGADMLSISLSQCDEDLRVHNLSEPIRIVLPIPRPQPSDAALAFAIDLKRNLTIQTWRQNLTLTEEDLPLPLPNITTMSVDQKLAWASDLSAINRSIADPTAIRALRSLSLSVDPRVCAFWDEEGGRWSSEGCVTRGDLSNATHLVCDCTHLTDFSALLEVTWDVFKNFGQAFVVLAERGIEALMELNPNNLGVWTVFAITLILLALIIFAWRWDRKHPLTDELLKRLLLSDAAIRTKYLDYLEAKERPNCCVRIYRSLRARMRGDKEVQLPAFYRDWAMARDLRREVEELARTGDPKARQLRNLMRRHETYQVARRVHELPTLSEILAAKMLPRIQQRKATKGQAARHSWPVLNKRGIGTMPMQPQGTVDSLSPSATMAPTEPPSSKLDKKKLWTMRSLGGALQQQNSLRLVESGQLEEAVRYLHRLAVKKQIVAATTIGKHWRGIAVRRSLGELGRDGKPSLSEPESEHDGADADIDGVQIPLSPSFAEAVARDLSTLMGGSPSSRSLPPSLFSQYMDDEQGEAEDADGWVDLRPDVGSKAVSMTKTRSEPTVRLSAARRGVLGKSGSSGLQQPAAGDDEADVDDGSGLFGKEFAGVEGTAVRVRVVQLDDYDLDHPTDDDDEGGVDTSLLMRSGTFGGPRVNAMRPLAHHRVTRDPSCVVWESAHMPARIDVTGRKLSMERQGGRDAEGVGGGGQLGRYVIPMGAVEACDKGQDGEEEQVDEFGGGDGDHDDATAVVHVSLDFLSRQFVLRCEFDHPDDATAFTTSVDRALHPHQHNHCLPHQPLTDSPNGGDRTSRTHTTAASLALDKDEGDGYGDEASRHREARADDKDTEVAKEKDKEKEVELLPMVADETEVRHAVKRLEIADWSPFRIARAVLSREHPVPNAFGVDVSLSRVQRTLLFAADVMGGFMFDALFFTAAPSPLGVKRGQISGVGEKWGAGEEEGEFDIVLLDFNFGDESSRLRLTWKVVVATVMSLILMWPIERFFDWLFVKEVPLVKPSKYGVASKGKGKGKSRSTKLDAEEAEVEETILWGIDQQQKTRGYKFYLTEDEKAAWVRRTRRKEWVGVSVVSLFIVIALFYQLMFAALLGENLQNVYDFVASNGLAVLEELILWPLLVSLVTILIVTIARHTRAFDCCLRLCPRMTDFSRAIASDEAELFYLQEADAERIVKNPGELRSYTTMKDKHSSNTKAKTKTKTAKHSSTSSTTSTSKSSGKGEGIGRRIHSRQTTVGSIHSSTTHSHTHTHTHTLTLSGGSSADGGQTAAHQTAPKAELTVFDPKPKDVPSP